MPGQVTCANCGTDLDDANGGTHPEQGKPCPVCGSTLRMYALNAEAGVYIVMGADVTFERISPSAVLVVKGIVSLGERTDEGRFITEVLAPWFEFIDLLTRDPEEAFRIPYWKWEEIIAGAYKRAGFDEVTLTPRKEDRGRDVIAVKKGLGTVRVIDQGKAYTPPHLVTADEVRALMGVLAAEPASSKGFLTTTSGFAPRLRTDPLIAPLIPGRIELIDGPQLLQRLADLERLSLGRTAECPPVDPPRSLLVTQRVRLGRAGGTSPLVAGP